MNSAILPYLVAIGTSGSEGLDDIVDLLRALSKPSAAIVLVVLHRPSDKVSHLREILGRTCGLPVVVARPLERVQSGTCYIGTPDGHLALMAHDLAHVVPGKNDRLRNRAVDVLFDFLAAYAGRRTIGIVLSGALSDGSRGLAAIHAAQGLTMVLDPGCKPRGMQQNAIDYDGPISFIGTAQQIACKIDQMIA